jgi:hypothetical protein
MAPPIEPIRLPNVVYNVEIISGEMDAIYNEILSKKEAIALLTAQMTRENSELVNLQTQLITLYIQQTGTFPGDLLRR